MADPLRNLVLPILAPLWSAWLDRGRVAVVTYLLEENRVLREQLGRRRVRFTNAQRSKLARAAKEIPRHVLMRLPTIVTPSTLLRWFRTLVCAKYDSSDRRSPGRPRTPADLRQLVVQMATDNPTWGYTRMRGALLNVGHDLSCSTIARMLRDRGISPSPERVQRTTWRQFLRSHADARAATDFFTVEVMTAVGIVRYFVLFVIELGTRRVDVLGITRDPCEAWMRIVARGATDMVDGCLRNMRYLICDRDPLFCRDFRDLLAARGVECPLCQGSCRLNQAKANSPSS